jgi:hypothetical protein
LFGSIRIVLGGLVVTTFDESRLELGDYRTGEPNLCFPPHHRRFGVAEPGVIDAQTAKPTRPSTHEDLAVGASAVSRRFVSLACRLFPGPRVEV